MNRLIIPLVPQDRADVPPLPVTVEFDEMSISLNIPGHGTACMEDGAGCPVWFELVDGVPHLTVWADINREDPTHRISLAGAANAARLPERSP